LSFETVLHSKRPTWLSARTPQIYNVFLKNFKTFFITISAPPRTRRKFFVQPRASRANQIEFGIGYGESAEIIPIAGVARAVKEGLDLVRHFIFREFVRLLWEHGRQRQKQYHGGHGRSDNEPDIHRLIPGKASRVCRAVRPQLRDETLSLGLQVIRFPARVTLKL
jgi:hypothetical protein